MQISEDQAILGDLKKSFPPSPAYVQRAIFIVVLSFLFFLAMMLAFYARQNIGYFILASAFLIVKLFTLFSFLSLKKMALNIHENGFAFRKQSCLWSGVKSISAKTSPGLSGGKTIYEIEKKNGEKILMSDAVANIETAIKEIEERIG